MDRRRTLVLCCVSVSTASLLVIVSIVTSPEPTEVGPSDIEYIELGTLVAVEGLVGSGGVTDLGGVVVFRLVGDDGGSVQVFAGFPTVALRPGDRVRLTGTVALYRGVPEVVVRSASDLTVLARDPRPRVPLADVIAGPWAYADVEPRVEVIVATPPVLSPGGNSSWCLVSGSPMGPTVAMLVPRDGEPDRWAVGARLEVACIVQYDATYGVVWLEPTEWRAV